MVAGRCRWNADSLPVSTTDFEGNVSAVHGALSTSSDFAEATDQPAEMHARACILL